MLDYKNNCYIMAIYYYNIIAYNITDIKKILLQYLYM